MNRLWILLLLPLLLGTTQTDVIQLDPVSPRLGEPLVMSLNLPDGDWELSAFPDLTPFQLLKPPIFKDSQLQLQLLPLRSGAAKIPALSLYKGSQVWISPELALEIIDPYLSADTPTPRHPWPTTTNPLKLWLLVALVVLTGLIGAGLCVKSRNRNTRIHTLAVFAERLAKQPESEQRLELERTLSGWRFGPYQPTTAELDLWQTSLADLERSA